MCQEFETGSFRQFWLGIFYENYFQDVSLLFLTCEADKFVSPHMGHFVRLLEYPHNMLSGYVQSDLVLRDQEAMST